MKIIPTTNGDFRGKRAEMGVYDDAMEIDMKYVILTLNYPTSIPNKNGAVFTQDAVQNAFTEVKTKQIPIIDYTQDEIGKVVGVATPSVYHETYNSCSISNDCFFFNNTDLKAFDMEYMINKSHKEEDITVIDDFRISSIGLFIREG